MADIRTVVNWMLIKQAKSTPMQEQPMLFIKKKKQTKQHLNCLKVDSDCVNRDLPRRRVQQSRPQYEDTIPIVWSANDGTWSSTSSEVSGSFREKVTDPQLFQVPSIWGCISHLFSDSFVR